MANAAAQPFPAPNLTAPQLTIRAILTGMVLGALLAPCNIYSGLKIGWSFNMSIAAALLSYAFWEGLHKTGVGRSWGLLENNINQTAASSAASIISAGLVAPIPALTVLTGRTLAWEWLTIWVFSVSLVGIVVAIGLRRQMLLVDRLPFPSGIATAETIKEIYGRGREAALRVSALIAGGVASAGLKVATTAYAIPKLAMTRASAGTATFTNLGFVLDPSLMMVGFGAIIGIRAGISLMLGAVVAWGVVAPLALDYGWAHPGDAGAEEIWFSPLLEWLLWPGVAMMVTASLTSFAFSWKSVAAALTGKRQKASAEDVQRAHEVPRRWFIGGLVAATILAVVTQNAFFEIAIWTAIFGVLLTFALAVVAGRVSGETGITPIGAMGKVTQLTFGVVAPGNPTANLMAANVTGGAAGQCADMLHDLKTGALIGASPRFQALAQMFGVLAGSLAGSAAYLVLVPDPANMLFTEEWPAPAAATWKAVAEVFMEGMSAMPPGSVLGIIIAGAAGIVLAILEKTLPKNAARWIPSPASVGLAFVIPAWNCLSMFAGAVLAFLVAKVARSWSERFVIVIAAGLVAGESLTGVVYAIAGVLGL